MHSSLQKQNIYFEVSFRCGTNKAIFRFSLALILYAFPMHMFSISQQDSSGIFEFRAQSTAFLSHEPACDLL